MEYVYAALILNATGKEVTEEGVTSVLNAAGATVNEVRAKALIAALEGIGAGQIAPGQTRLCDTAHGEPTA